MRLLLAAAWVLALSSTACAEEVAPPAVGPVVPMPEPDPVESSALPPRPRLSEWMRLSGTAASASHVA
jgi:hypothetical protein